MTLFLRNILDSSWIFTENQRNYSIFNLKINDEAVILTLVVHMISLMSACPLRSLYAGSASAGFLIVSRSPPFLS